MKKRFLSLLLCFAMLFGTIPISASAAEEAEAVSESQTAVLSADST